MGSQGAGGQGFTLGRWKRPGGGRGDDYTAVRTCPIPLNSVLKRVRRVNCMLCVCYRNLKGERRKSGPLPTTV